MHRHRTSTLVLLVCPPLLVHLVAVEDVGEIHYFENWISWLPYEFPFVRNCGSRCLGEQHVALAKLARLQLATTEGRDQLRFRLSQTTHAFIVKLRDWDDSDYRILQMCSSFGITFISTLLFKNLIILKGRLKWAAHWPLVE